jgi:hypothetical protein
VFVRDLNPQLIRGVLAMIGRGFVLSVQGSGGFVVVITRENFDDAHSVRSVWGHGRSLPSMASQHLCILHIGSEVFAGAKNFPFILNIATPAHPCARGIPFILNIKKPPEKVAYIK